MNLSFILNNSNSEEFSTRYQTKVSRTRPSLDHPHPQLPIQPPQLYSRTTSSTSTHSANTNSYFAHRGESVNSLTPLERALPPLSRANSDDSTARSPITPLYTPATTSFERDQKRHSQKHESQRGSCHWPDRSTDTGSLPDSPTRSMDLFKLDSHPDYSMEGMRFSNSFSPPQMHQYQQTSTNPQPPMTDLPELVPSTPAPRTDQQSPSSGQNSQKNQKKNAYPCPVSKQYSCQEYFTTSGHAARHAKKHTGKKDAVCPDCQKAFTRKDNMEQHRRTHSSGRLASKHATSIDESRQKKVMKLQHQQKKSSAKVPTVLAQDTPDHTELPRQGMSAKIIDPHSFIVDQSQMSTVDPLLNTSPSQTAFSDNMHGVGMGFSPHQSMHYMQDIHPIAAPNMSRVRLQHPSGTSHTRNASYSNVSSPSADSSSGFAEGPRSPLLDMLADAAAARSE